MSKAYRSLQFRFIWQSLLVWPVAYLLSALFWAVLLFVIYRFEDPLRTFKHATLDRIIPIPIVEWTDTLFTLTIILCAIFFYYLISRQLARTLQAVEKGVAAIDDDSDKLIVLPDGLKPIEHELNTVKQTMRHKSLEAKLAEQQKSDLVVYLAHDLKTPLTSIIGYSNIIHETPDLPLAMNQRYNGIVYTKAKRMESLLDDLFEITRFNAQSISLTKTPVDLNLMLEQLAEEFYPSLLEKQLTVALKLDGTFHLVLDGDQMARVFDNLLRNAVHYSESGSTIKIQMYAQDEQLRIVFANYGVTIPPEKLSRIFEKFYRADDSRSTASGGSGLGLAIAKTIVEAHGGEIKAESANLWTTFTISLPLTDAFRKS